MKRVLILVCLSALVLALGVSPALAAEHQLAAGAHASPSPFARSFRPAAQAALSAFSPEGAQRIRPAFGGGTAVDPVKLPFPSELPSGSVSATGTTDDVYWFYMDAGTEMDFNLDPSNHGAQIALKVFPDGSDLSEAQALLSDTYYVYPHTTAFTAPHDGYFLLDIRAVNGASDYTMPYDWWMGPNDDIYPADDAICPMLPPSTYSEWLSANWDPNDVYRAPLRSGDKLSLSLDALYGQYGASDNLNLDLYLYGPDATSVSTAVPLMDSVAAAPSIDAFTYKATTTGNHFVDVYIPSGSGYSRLSWKVSPIHPSIFRSPSSAKPTYKRKKGSVKYTLSGRFTNGLGLQVAGTKVILQTSSNGKKWKSSYTLTTNALGSASKTFTAKKKGVTYYRWAIKSASGKYYYSSLKVTVK